MVRDSILWGVSGGAVPWHVVWVHVVKLPNWLVPHVCMLVRETLLSPACLSACLLVGQCGT